MTVNQPNALNLLSIYNHSDSDSENEIPGPRVSVKRCFKDDDENSVKSLKTERLPVPSIFKLTTETTENNLDQSDLHGGRIRSFPHERGNWSTYIYIPYQRNDVIEDLINDIIEKCKPFLILQQQDDLHISLTRTVVLRHHWIESFNKTITDNVANIPGFLILFERLNIYCNEERTRTFIGIQIKTGHDSLINLVQILDKCLQEFNLPKFYEDPSFHMSLLWCVGDCENILNNVIDELNAIVFDYISNHPQYYWYIHVKHLMCKTGNKFFNFTLNQGS